MVLPRMSVSSRSKRAVTEVGEGVVVEEGAEVAELGEEARKSPTLSRSSDDDWQAACEARLIFLLVLRKWIGG